MELNEARRAVVSYRDEETERVISYGKTAAIILDNRITELEAQRNKLFETLLNLLKNQSGNGKDFFKALKEAMAVVDKIKQANGLSSSDKPRV